ncbi:YtxH domain-containing protein [Cryobacterium tagatosivorans]|uniref:YtxH domain-containing protein n=1 Tax=Cryobacterium tagatosivorans TaxID=1259199 RepID=UPI0015804BF9|nr:YtxH domain-containing protein [Cryobacterium tagatosivorans]
MRGKLLFITGGLVGYVLGARAGRKRYEQITASAKELWNAPPVQRRVTEVRDFALEAVGDVPAVLFEAGKKAFASVQGKVQDKVQGKVQTKVQDTSARPAPAESASAARTAAAVKVAKGSATTSAKSRPAKSTAKPAESAAKPAAAATDSSEPTAN